MPYTHHTRFENMYPAMWILCVSLFLMGIMIEPPEQVLRGLKIILTTEDGLITDYIRIAGPGAAFLNSAVVTSISALILHYSREPLNGVSMVVIGLMSGFSFFGKNFLNIWPILFGAWLYSVVRRDHFGKYVTVALMSTALAPAISYIALDSRPGAPIISLLVGMVIGFIMPPLSAYTFKIQNGMNLYNMGFSCGLVATVLVALMTSLGADLTTYYHWATGYNHVFAPMMTATCGIMIVGGLFFCQTPWRRVWAGYRRLLTTNGRAPSDYLRMFGFPPVLVNTGINGLIGMSFILLTGGDLNGPTIGGIFTIMGFSAFGKHARNILPVMFGVLLGSQVMNWSISDSPVQLACLFCTTLAPVSGYFGWPYGVLAGFLHSSLVLSVGSPVSGMNLYNNGFAGGLLAIVLYPLIIDIAHHRKLQLQDEDYFEIMTHEEPQAPKDHEVEPILEEFEDELY